MEEEKEITKSVEVHEVNIKNKCKFCEKSFPTQLRFNGHMKYCKKEGIEDLLKCEVCQQYFSRNGSLDMHMESALDGIKADHICEICEKDFSQKRINCKICGMPFFSKLNLNTHMQNIRNKDYKCEVSFTERGTLRKHFQTVHEGHKDFKCNFCGKSFTEGHNLNKHIEHVHEETSKPKENVLSLLFTNPDGTGPSKYGCTRCGRSYQNPATLNRHQRYECGIQLQVQVSYPCEYCKRKYKRRHFLKAHMEKHNASGMVTPTVLNSHMKSDHKCELCKQYFDLSSLNSHLKTCKSSQKVSKVHEGQNINGKTNNCLTVGRKRPRILLPKPETLLYAPHPILNQCGLCDEKFDNLVELNNHMKSEHSMGSRQTFKFDKKYINVIEKPKPQETLILLVTEPNRHMKSIHEDLNDSTLDSVEITHDESMQKLNDSSHELSDPRQDRINSTVHTEEELVKESNNCDNFEPPQLAIKVPNDNNLKFGDLNNSTLGSVDISYHDEKTLPKTNNSSKELTNITFKDLSKRHQKAQIPIKKPNMLLPKPDRNPRKQILKEIKDHKSLSQNVHETTSGNLKLKHSESGEMPVGSRGRRRLVDPRSPWVDLRAVGPRSLVDIDTDHKCEFCRKSFSYKESLDIHKKMVHEKIKDHKCGICGKGFFFKENLDSHMGNCKIMPVEMEFEPKITNEETKLKHRSNEIYNIETFDFDSTIEIKMESIQK